MSRTPLLCDDEALTRSSDSGRGTQRHAGDIDINSDLTTAPR